MIGKLNHVAMVVPDLAAASSRYRQILGADVSQPLDLPEHGVTSVFIQLPNSRVELLHPLGDDSPIAGFLEKNPAGAMHHICYEVADIETAARRLESEGARILAPVKTGAHGKPVLFLHPGDFFGTLIELEEA